MDNSLTQKIERLREIIQLANETKDKYKFQDPAYEIIEELHSLEEPFHAVRPVRPIFELIESSPAIDFGGPGPFGSFLESFFKQGYEEELVASLNRKPTVYTIFLMFRIIANKGVPNRKEYIKLLKSLEDAPCLEGDQFWKDEIIEL